MFGDRSPEVLVTGAGPVGLFSALTLAEQNVAVQIVDTGVWPCTHSYALALHPQSVELFAELGMRDEILASAYQVHTIGLFDHQNRRAEIRLAEPMLVLRQDVLENLLETRLRELGVRVQWRHELSALQDGRDHVSARVDKYEKESRGYVIARSEWVVTKSIDTEYRFVVGSDGYKSRVRHALNTGFPEVGPAAYYAVFEFSSSSKLDNEMRLVLGATTTDVLWPLPDGGCRWSFQLPEYSDLEAEQLKDYLADSGAGHVPTKRAKDRSLVSHWEHMAVLEESNLRSLLAERAPWFTGSIDDLRWATVIRFERRLAERFGSGRMWLAGDSAHLTGPAGIQSMNAGLFEAHDLGVRMAHILRDGASLDGLAEYNRKWTGVWRQLHGIDSGLRPQAGADPWVVQHADQLLSCLPAHGDDLVRLAAQLNLQAASATAV